MKAVVFHGIGDIRLDDVPMPKLKKSTDAVVRITRSAICGTDLHMVRGTMVGMKPGTILGHEAVGIVEELGSDVRNLNVGDRVVIPSTIACGYCSYCRDGYYAQCDNANPKGSQAGTAFFGGPETTGPFDGLQAEYARVPYANVGLVKIPDSVSDDRAVLLSDIFPTGYYGADLAEILPGDTVAVFGCGPVGQFAIAGAKMMDAGRVIAVDKVPSRLAMARKQGAEVINFNEEDPVAVIKALTGGIGVDRAIDAVGIDAEAPEHGKAAKKASKMEGIYRSEMNEIAPVTEGEGEQWQPGGAPSIVAEWAVQSVAKAGTLSVIGVYPETMRFFPIGTAMMKNLTLNMGNCNHRKYVPHLLEIVASGAFDPYSVITNVEPLSDVIKAYESFDRREDGWVKVSLVPGV